MRNPSLNFGISEKNLRALPLLCERYPCADVKGRLVSDNEARGIVMAGEDESEVLELSKIVVLNGVVPCAEETKHFVAEVRCHQFVHMVEDAEKTVGQVWKNAVP